VKRCFRCTLFAFLCLATAVWAHALTTPAERPFGSADAAGHIVFGDSDVPLYGPWRFHIGDSPVDPVTHAPLWAQPGFDDSAWETVSLKPEPGLTDPYNGDPRYVRGWTAKGYPGYMGYAWYRLRVPAPAKDGVPLALASPIYVDDGYQVFANGELLGGFGKFDNLVKPPVVFSTMPAMLLLPESASRGAGGDPATQVIAFRVWMGPMGLTHSPYAGGLHYAPYLGEAVAIGERVRLDWLELGLQSAFAPFEGVLLLLLGIVAACLMLFDRSDRVYPWVAGVLIFTALADGALSIFTLTQVLSLRTYFMFFDVFSNPLILCGWIMVWWYWFRLRRPAWIPKAVLALMLLYMVTKAIGGDFFYGADLHAPATTFNVISVAVRLIFLPLLIFIVVVGIREQGREGWLVLPAVVPLIISQFASELIVLNLPVKWAPFGITIFVGQVSNLVSVAAISLLLLRRLLLSVRRQRLMAIDVRQAQEVQQVILPEMRTVVPGLVIESEYRPAQQVGGDFFQIIPHATDGSLLIVVGDVNGKSLRAGMLVALLVGAIRSTAQFDPDPVVMLGALNQRLIGRSNAVATCMALRIDADGQGTLANAGHVPPYLNEEPLAVEGSLPLGLVKDAEFSLQRFQLNDGDRLVLMSDGIAEATNDEGQLFGFDRVHDLLRTAKTPAEVVGAAKGFGQEDDISVISVTRIAAPAATLA
jgi:Stage II sporulation protein E (SpoIIE)